MKRSPIQLVQSNLLKIAIEPVQEDRFKNRRPSNPFEYEKVVLETAREFVKFPEYWEGSPPIEGLEDKTYLVQLGLRTPIDGAYVGPYKFEAVYSGVISILPNRKQGSISDDDLALQFGLTLLYGLIREQIGNLTYKMMWGQALLPTMSFLDEKHEAPEEIRSQLVAATPAELAIPRATKD